MSLNENVRIRIKLEAQRILRLKNDSIEEKLENLEKQYKNSSGDRKESIKLLISYIESGLENRQTNVNDAE